MTTSEGAPRGASRSGLPRNLVNTADLSWAATRLHRRAPHLVRRVAANDRDRTIDNVGTCQPNDQWWIIPAIVRRWNRMVTGDPGTDHYDYLAGKYLAGGSHVGLSVGCGDGQRELAWARTGVFETLVGVDLTPSQIERARSSARAEDLDRVLRFEVADLTEGPPAGIEPDVIVGEHSLHHLAPLEQLLPAFRDMLRPGGLMLLDEFVGPTKFQWTDAQLHCANSLLGLLPPRLRTDLRGQVRTKVIRPSLLYMRLTDPSEAIESSLILPLMDRFFERVEIRPYGGSVLHILLSNIAHNFVDESDEQAAHWLRWLMEAEDNLLEDGRIDSDFVVAVYRKP